VTETVVERYLRLALRLARHDDGIVDAYFGPPELAADAEAGSPIGLPVLIAEAESLLGELADGWVRDQVVALRTYAGVLAGESWAYADEVRACFGVRPEFTPESVFAAAHEQLDELLPGSGPLAERYLSWRNTMLVPAPQLERIFERVIAEAQTQTRKLVELPAGERTVLETVEDVPWLGYNFYLGGLCGRIAVNVSISKSAIELLNLALHETYPGHQAERACKEQLLVTGRAMTEETLVLAPSPQSVVSEGIARLAPELLLAGDDGPAFAAIIGEAGLEFDLTRALEIETAIEPCEWAQVNAALMLHEGGDDPASVREYLMRWGLHGPELADHLLRFLTDPSSRSYMIAYPAGLKLCRGFVQDQPERFGQLITEQFRVTDLQRASECA
jgi:hypothetical protein